MEIHKLFHYKQAHSTIVYRPKANSRGANSEHSTALNTLGLYSISTCKVVYMHSYFTTTMYIYAQCMHLHCKWFAWKTEFTKLLLGILNRKV